MPRRELQPFKDLVAQRCGLTFDEVSEANLLSALHKRMAATGAETTATYFTRLIADEVEFHELVTLLTVNETYFFREPAQLTLLVEGLIPRLMTGRAAGQPIRILSAGCSTGEEPYSIAIALKEKFGDSVGHLVSICAGDIDHRALTTARRGEYGEFSFRALSPNLRDRHFVSTEPRRYVLHEGVRSLVEFHHLNLLSPVYPKAIRGFDIVFFRNVSIYFDVDTRRAILANLRAAMTETGILVLGASETLANDLGVFHLVEEGGGFYFAKTPSPPEPRPAPKRPVPARLPPAPPRMEVARSAAAPVPRRSPPTVDWAAAVDSVRHLLRRKKHQEALEVVQAMPAASPADVRSWLLESHVRLQMRQFAEAAALATRAVDHDPWSVDALMLLALVAKWQGDEAAAIDRLKAIVYSKPDCWSAHYTLGTLLQGGDPAKARRAYATALRQVVANPDPDGGMWLPLDLPVADIRFLCERRCAEFDAAAPVVPIAGDRR